MSEAGWSTFSFTELLLPPDGWRTDHAILSTYSADLVVIVTSLLALSGCELDGRRGSRVELVKAIEALSGRVRILAQEGRVAIPSTREPILRLLDKFLSTMTMDETVGSFHPKAVLLRLHKTDDPQDRQWRIWLGSRNLTRAMNWEAGIVLVSRSDGKGQYIEGLPAAVEAFAAWAQLPDLTSKSVRAELSKLKWECPPGCDVTRVSLLGPERDHGFPEPPADTERMFVVSPFLDATTVRRAAQWGGPKTCRSLVSTDPEFQRLVGGDGQIFDRFEHLCRQPLPDLPMESAADSAEEDRAAMETAEGEDAPPQGLHAKILFAAKGKRRQLWLGSANATARGWSGRNVEIVAELSVSQEIAKGIEAFVDTCERRTPVAMEAIADKDEETLEIARKALSGRWTLTQTLRDQVLEIVAVEPPPVADPAVVVEVAAMGGAWQHWPTGATRVGAGNIREWERTNFIQIRVRLGDKTCAWLQVALCDPPPDEKRDHGVIARYLDPNTFLAWLRSLLADSPAESAGGDWDSNADQRPNAPANGFQPLDPGAVPTVEEILRAWARDASAFRNADQKVKTYLAELERRADETNLSTDVELLKTFRKIWNTLAGELA